MYICALPIHSPTPKQQIFGRSVNANTKQNVNSIRSRGGGQDAGKVPGSFVPGDEADIRVKWQEKIFGPSDIVTLSSAQRSGLKPQQHHTAVPRLEVRRRGIRSELRLAGSMLPGVSGRSGAFRR